MSDSFSSEKLWSSLGKLKTMPRVCILCNQNFLKSMFFCSFFIGDNRISMPYSTIIMQVFWLDITLFKEKIDEKKKIVC